MARRKDASFQAWSSFVAVVSLIELLLDSYIVDIDARTCDALCRRKGPTFSMGQSVPSKIWC